MFRILHSLHKLILLHTPLTLHPSIQQNTLELLHPQLAQILLLQLLRLDRELDRANLRIVLINSLTKPVDGHAEGEGLGDVAFDGVDVVADFAFARGEGVLGAVGAEGRFDCGFGFMIGFGHCVADFLHYFHADCAGGCIFVGWI